MSISGTVRAFRSASEVENANGDIVLLLASETGDETIVDASHRTQNFVEVSAVGNAAVEYRPKMQDVFVEVPQNTPKCGYDLACADIPTMYHPIVLTNPDPQHSHSVRLSFSRNFPTWNAALDTEALRFLAFYAKPCLLYVDLDRGCTVSGLSRLYAQRRAIVFLSVLQEHPQYMLRHCLVSALIVIGSVSVRRPTTELCFCLHAHSLQKKLALFDDLT